MENMVDDNNFNNEKHTKARVLLGIIGILNVIASYFDSDPYFVILLQIVLGMALFMGYKLVRWLFIISSFLGIIISSYLVVYYINLGYDESFMIYNMCSAIFTFMTLLFSKEIKVYIKTRKIQN